MNFPGFSLGPELLRVNLLLPFFPPPLSELNPFNMREHYVYPKEPKAKPNHPVYRRMCPLLPLVTPFSVRRLLPPRLSFSFPRLVRAFCQLEIISYPPASTDLQIRRPVFPPSPLPALLISFPFRPWPSPDKYRLQRRRSECYGNSPSHVPMRVTGLLSSFS